MIAVAVAWQRQRRRHPIIGLVIGRLLAGVVTLWIVSLLVFGATEILPGNAAVAILGKSATPESLHALEARLHLNRSIPQEYGIWISQLVRGNLGTSLANDEPVWAQVEPRLVNSAVLVGIAGAIGTAVGLVLGGLAALRRDSAVDHSLSIAALAITALPEFVVALVLVIVFATVVWHLLPAVSLLPPGTYAWSQPRLLILPVATLILVVVPYIFRMTRGAMVEALEADYVELARLKGLSTQRVVIVHALPNALAPIVQVIGLVLLYLAGGIVVVEYVFNYPGIGQGLVSAVSARDVPMIQLMVIMLPAFYVLVNIFTDVVSILVTPRRRLPR